jgi:hypothetical protein
MIVTDLKELEGLVDSYVLVTEDSIHIPGDERSQTHPGHGYPAETRKYMQIRTFESFEKLGAEVIRLDKRGVAYKMLKVTSEEVTISSTINIKR